MPPLLLSRDTVASEPTIDLGVTDVSETRARPSEDQLTPIDAHGTIEVVTAPTCQGVCARIESRMNNGSEGV